MSSNIKYVSEELIERLAYIINLFVEREQDTSGYFINLTFNRYNIKVDLKNKSGEIISTETIIIPVDNVETEDSQNLITSGAVYSALALKQNTLVFDVTPTLNSNNPVTSDGIRNAINNAISSAYMFKGSKTCQEINNMNSSDLVVGWVYNVTDSGVITLGNLSVLAGDNIAWTGSVWDKLAGTLDTSPFVTYTGAIANIDLNNKNLTNINQLRAASATISGATSINGNTSITGNESITGNLTLSGNLTDGTYSINVRQITEKQNAMSAGDYITITNDVISVVTATENDITNLFGE